MIHEIIIITKRRGKAAKFRRYVRFIFREAGFHVDFPVSAGTSGPRWRSGFDRLVYACKDHGIAVPDEAEILNDFKAVLS